MVKVSSRKIFSKYQSSDNENIRSSNDDILASSDTEWSIQQTINVAGDTIVRISTESREHVNLCSSSSSQHCQTVSKWSILSLQILLFRWDKWTVSYEEIMSVLLNVKTISGLAALNLSGYRPWHMMRSWWSSISQCQDGGSRVSLRWVELSLVWSPGSSTCISIISVISGLFLVVGRDMDTRNYESSDSE